MRRLPPLASLRAFEAAARHLSFERAAAELGVTPTAISHQIRIVEDVCGRTLFRRRPRPLTLTEAGQRLFPVLCTGLDAFAAAVESVRHEPEQSPLRVTTPNAFASQWLVPRLPDWRACQPQFPLEVIGTNAVLDLHAGQADVALRYTRARPTQGAVREMFCDRYTPVCSPALLAAGKGVRRAADLLHYPLIHFDWARQDDDVPTWRRWLAKARQTEPGLPDAVARCNLSFREELHAIDAVIAGQGVAICSDVVVGRELQAGRLVRAHELALSGYAYYLVWLPDHPRQKAIDAFCQWAQSVA